MVRLFFTLVAVMLSACASQLGPVTSVAEDWTLFGEEQAQVGYEKLSFQELQSSAKIELTVPLYQAYSSGYEKGRAEYCQQDPRLLGKRGEMYRGICDELRPTFRTWYMNGKASRGRDSY
ncbi:DUF2799 domain-containing protein [Vibrio parahaemolyticus]|uniref:DUF2799 domain-containing protein n=1 Tax=Vibrio mediterranei TaxID=689 RepID=UPI004067E9C0